MNNKHPLHEDGITKLVLKNGNLECSLNYYDDDRNVYVPYSIVFFSVTGLTVNHVPVSDITQPPGEGEVLRYKGQDKKAWLLTEWIDYDNNKETTTHLYEFEFDHLETDDSRIW